MDFPYYIERNKNIIHEVFAEASHSETLEKLFLVRNFLGDVYACKVLPSQGKSNSVKKSQDDLKTSFKTKSPTRTSKTINNVKIGASYSHRKGGIYTVVGVGNILNEAVTFVFYKDSSGDFWARPFSMWFELVDGKPRFQEIIN